MATAEDYDLYYQILGLAPGAPEKAIRSARAKLAKEIHPDRWNGSKESTRKMAELNHAVDALVSHWNKNKCAPPSVKAEAERRAKEEAAQKAREAAKKEQAAREAKAAAEREQKRQEEAARAAELEKKKAEEWRRANAPLVAPAMKSTISGELIDFVEEKKDWWPPIWGGGVFGSLILAAYISNHTFGPAGYSTGRPTFVIWMALLYLVIYGAWAYKELHLLLKSRLPSKATLNAEELRSKIRTILEQSPSGAGGQKWTVEHWQANESDASQIISAKLFFTSKILGFVNVHYKVEFHAKYKPTTASQSGNWLVCWFSYTSTIPWAPPIKKIVSEIDRAFLKN